MKITTRLLVALAFVVAARAADPAAAPEYINAAAFDWRAVVSPPPAEDSIAGRADQEIAIQLDLHRTPEQVVLAKRYEKSLEEFAFMAPVLGDWCTAENLPRTRAFFKQANAESRPVIDAAKSAWNRSRPYIYNPALHPAVEKPNNASYPSGHAYTASWIGALLSAALPEFAADWDRQAQVIRWSRLVGGAHYPNDIVAGKVLGEAVARELLKSPRLQHDLEEVRAELRRQMANHTAAPSQAPPVSGTSAHPVVSSRTNVLGMDAKWSAYDEYLNALIAAVQKEWYRIQRESRTSPPRGSQVTVTFRLNAKGETDIIKVEDTGAGKDAVFSCANAITYTQPYPKWTKAMIATLGDSQELTFSFYYQ